MRRVVLNIVGLAGSGKGTVCKYLVDNYGFELFHTSDVLRKYAKDTGRILTQRQDYIDTHKAINKDDPLAIIRPILESKSNLICIDGLRAPAAFAELRSKLNAKLIYLECPIDLRLARIQADEMRSGHRQAQSLQNLIEDEQPDFSNPDPYLPNMDEMYQIADYKIDASLPLAEVLQNIVTIVDELI